MIPQKMCLLIANSGIFYRKNEIGRLLTKNLLLFFPMACIMKKKRKRERILLKKREQDRQGKVHAFSIYMNERCSLYHVNSDRK